jgi:hypothetical protein
LLGKKRKRQTIKHGLRRQFRPITSQNFQSAASQQFCFQSFLFQLVVQDNVPHLTGFELSVEVLLLSGGGGVKTTAIVVLVVIIVTIMIVNTAFIIAILTVIIAVGVMEYLVQLGSNAVLHLVMNKEH